MKVLVATASRHGSTAEVSQAMGQALRARGLEADVSRVEDVGSLEGYDGVVLGSAIYLGRWLEPAVRFAEDRADELARCRVWLFSSGPVGDPALHTPPAEATAIAQRVRAEENKIFPGRLDKGELDEEELAVVAAVRRKEGDYRDWAAVRRWAGRIADTLLSERPA